MIQKVIKNILFFAAFVACSTQGFAMTTSDYVERWEIALKNPNHLPSESFSEQPEVKSLMEELSQAFSMYKAEVEKAKSDNEESQLCLPRQGGLQIYDIIAAAKELPAEWQSREFYESFREIMRIRYPCSRGVGTVP